MMATGSGSGTIKGRPRLSVVLPAFNEAAALRVLYPRLSTILNQLEYDTEVIFVDDGSSDETVGLVRGWARVDSRVTLIQLSRNFGHQRALTAGLDHADGNAIITMDADGQHPPELIPEMIRLYEAGHDVVLTQRQEDPAVGLFKSSTSRIFYSLLNRLSDVTMVPASADFRLLSRKVILGLRGMREQHRFLRGLVAWMGFRTAIIPFEAAPRMAGRPVYTVNKMLRLGFEALFSFSMAPILLSFIAGSLFLFLAALDTIYVLSFWISGRQAELVPGWTSLTLLLLILGGVVLVMLGILGCYIALVFHEVKARPLYLIQEVYRPSDRRSSATR